MARIRSIKPEFWTDRALCLKLSRDARMFYAALWNFCDEHGRVSADPFYLKGQIFPYEPEGPDWIDSLIDQLVAAGKAIRYEGDGDPYLFLPRLDRHQRLEPEKVPSRLPAPSEEDLTTPPPSPGPGSKPAEAQVEASAQIHADSSESRADESAQGADESSLLYVAGCMEQVAGSREHVPPRADSSQPPLLALVGAEPLAPLAERPPDLFEEFWKAYPRHVGKAKAKTAFATKVKNGADPTAIVAAAKSYADRCRATRQDTQFIPHPTTWLNRESWTDNLDEVLPPAATGTGGYQPYQNRPDRDYHGSI